MADRRGMKLVNAVWDGNVARVEALLAEGVPLSEPKIAGPALLAAVSMLQQPMVELLLRAGADPNAREDEDNPSALHRAAMHDPAHPATARVVRLLVEHGAALDQRDYLGAPPLFEAVKMAAMRGPAGEAMGVPFVGPPLPVDEPAADRFSVIDTFLDLGAGLDAQNNEGVTAVMIAAEYRDDELVARLGRRGGDVRETAAVRLVTAASEGDEAAVAALLAEGADPNRRTSTGTPLTNAAQYGHLAVVERLLAAGADPDLAESDSAHGDFNPLFSATYAGNLEIVRRLLAAGANPQARGPGGARLLDYARLAVAEGHKRDRPWDDLMALLREATQGGPATLRLAPLDREPAVVTALRASVPELAAVEWRRARAGALELFESSSLERAPADWEQLAGIAREHGFAAVLAGWTLDAAEPDVAEVTASLSAVSAAAGREWLANAEAQWRSAAEEEAAMLEELGEEDDEDDESTAATLRAFAEAPIPRRSAPVTLRARRCHLVLTQASPETVAVVYRFQQPDDAPEVYGSVLRAWREETGAELAAFARDTMDVVLPKPIEDDAEVRRRALELLVFDTDLGGGMGVLEMAASRHWSFWWD